MGLPQTKDEWVVYATETKMPVFGVTASKMAAIAKDDNSSASGLGRIVLSDPTMTARVLQIANSVYYNPSGQQIKTISRAIVLLGFDKIHAICISVSIIDNLIKGKNKDRLLKRVATSFHAAFQAKSLTELLGEGSPEEVFIASLLLHLGEMLIWCFGDEQAEALEKALNLSVDPPEKVQEQVLGFPLNELTLDLSAEWNLGDTLTKAASGNSSGIPWVECVILGNTLAENLDNGWQDPKVVQTIEKMSDLLGLKPRQLTLILKNNSIEAIRQAKMYKLPHAELYIPHSSEDDTEPDVETKNGEQVVDVKFDDSLQIEILRELSGTVAKTPELNIILQLVLEGLHRGVGLDRVMVALLSQDRKQLHAKFVLSNYDEGLTEDFHITLSREGWQLFAKVMVTKACMWVGNPEEPNNNALLSNQITHLLETKQFYINPIMVGEKAIGIFYADRQPSGRALDEKSNDAFKHFCREANLALTLLKKQGH